MGCQLNYKASYVEPAERLDPLISGMSLLRVPSAAIKDAAKEEVGHQPFIFIGWHGGMQSERNFA